MRVNKAGEGDRSGETESRGEPVGDRPRRGGHLLSLVARAMGKRFADLMRSAGLGDIGSGEGRIVYLLWSHGEMRQGELAAKAGVDKSTLALTLSRMEKKGMIERHPDAEDARALIVSLHPETAARASDFDMVSARMNDLFYADFSDAEIEVFEKSLDRILANLAVD